MEKGDKDIKTNLDQLIDWFAKNLPDPARVKADLLKFAKMHDRRSYQLIRFCFSPDSDYRTVYKAIVSAVSRCHMLC
jgi:sister-chromatid-cohesion protein PDS5